MTEESGKPKRGFAGLSSMVSVVNVPEPTKPLEGEEIPQQTPPKRGAPLKFNAPPPTPEIPFWNKSRLKWAGVIFISLVVIGVLSGKKEAPSPTYSSTPSYTPPPTYSQEPAYPTYTPPAYTPPTTYESSTSEDVPPIGTDHVLTESQLRYCLSQKIRLDGWETQVNSYSDYSVKSFNSAIQHYNSRCGSFKYRQQAMTSVNSQVEAIRSTLYSEGIFKAVQYSDK